MKKTLVFLAHGFEEIEALTVVDVLRRAGVQVDLCSVEKELLVKAAHDIKVEADFLLKDLEEPKSYDCIYTPGGWPGAATLRDTPEVIELIQSFYNKENKIIAAICAAPIVLGKAGITEGLSGTCYPGFEKETGFANYQKKAVVKDRNVYTSIGAGAAFALAFALTEALVSKEMADKLYEGMMLPYAK